MEMRSASSLSEAPEGPVKSTMTFWLWTPSTSTPALSNSHRKISFSTKKTSSQQSPSPEPLPSDLITILHTYPPLLSIYTSHYSATVLTFNFRFLIGNSLLSYLFEQFGDSLPHQSTALHEGTLQLFHFSPYLLSCYGPLLPQISLVPDKNDEGL